MLDKKSSTEDGRMPRNEARHCFHLPADSAAFDHERETGDDDEQEECSYITFTTSESRCDALFDRGVEMVAQGDPTSALSIFLETLTALQDCQYNNKLLPTLYQLAEIFRVVGEVEKSKEIASTVSIMQEALDSAMREKWKERKRLGRSGIMCRQEENQQQTDCGALFLSKVEECCNEISETQSTERALELSENVFRILQFVLGPQHPRTLQSLNELTKHYTTDSGIHLELSDCLEPIMFTATIRHICTQISEQRRGEITKIPVPKSGINLVNCSIICHNSEDFSSSSEDESQWCLVEGSEQVETTSLPVGSCPQTSSSITTMDRDVYSAPLQSFSSSGGDNNQSKFQVCSNNSAPCGETHGIIISLSLCQSNLASFLTLLVAFGLMAVAAALSVY